MPQSFARLNPYGVPWIPVIIATALPVLVVAFSPDQISLMELYAIGVVGAITVNLGSCVFNSKLDLKWHERSVMAVTAVILLAVELTLAKTKPNALFFIICILIAGFALRARRRAAEPPRWERDLSSLRDSLTLLHELAHVIGAVPSDDSSVGGFARSQENTELIVRHCQGEAGATARKTRLLAKLGGNP